MRGEATRARGEAVVQMLSGAGLGRGHILRIPTSHAKNLDQRPRPGASQRAPGRGSPCREQTPAVRSRIPTPGSETSQHLEKASCPHGHLTTLLVPTGPTSWSCRRVTHSEGWCWSSPWSTPHSGHLQEAKQCGRGSGVCNSGRWLCVPSRGGRAHRQKY